MELWPTLPLNKARGETKGQAALKAPSGRNVEMETIDPHY